MCVRQFGPGLSYPRAKASVLSSTPATLQRTLTLAVVATIVCAPLLLLDLIWSSGPSSKVVPVAGASVTELLPAPEPEGVAVTTTITIVPVTTTTAASTSASPTSTARVASAQSWSAPAPAPTTTAAPPPPPVTAPPAISSSDAEFLACVRSRESGGNYAIVDGSGNYMGAYQFSQSTWNSIASRAGRADLVGVAPNTVSPADQDAIAYATLAISGRSPWGGICG